MALGIILGPSKYLANGYKTIFPQIKEAGA
jgi:hypothetical protein